VSSLKSAEGTVASCAVGLAGDRAQIARFGALMRYVAREIYNDIRAIIKTTTTTANRRLTPRGASVLSALCS
jgi:hypothetical protein